jgi:hypothetical protein
VMCSRTDPARWQPTARIGLTMVHLYIRRSGPVGARVCCRAPARAQRRARAAPQRTLAALRSLVHLPMMAVMARFTSAFPPPPRPVPPLLALGVMFGGFMQLFGALFFSAGMGFAWLFAADVDALAQLAFHGPTVRTTATVSGVTPSGKEGRRPLFEVSFGYVHEGVSWSGQGYTFDGLRYEKGQPIQIEVRRNAPGRTRAEDLRIKRYGPEGLVTLIFPAVGIALLMSGTRRGLHALRLLKTGVLTTGRLVKKERTGGHVNNQPIYALTFAFRDQRGGSHTAEARTHETARLTDDSAEPLLYAPDKPDGAVMLDELPTLVEIRGNGQLAVGNPLTMVFRVALVLLLLGVHGFVALAFF